MLNMENQAFRELINRKFAEYQLAEGRRVTVTEFAEKLSTGTFNVNQGDLSHWLKGRRPPKTIDTVRKLASNPLIGPEIWRAVGMVPDDALLLRALQALDRLPAEQQEHYVTEIEGAAVRNRERERGNTPTGIPSMFQQALS